MKEPTIINMSAMNPWMDVEIYLGVRGCLPDTDKGYDYTKESLCNDFINMKKSKAQHNLGNDLMRYINTLTYAKKCLKNI